MKFINNTKMVVRLYVNNGFPADESNLVTSGDYAAGEASVDLSPGDYMVRITTTNIGEYPPGKSIAASGGVSSDATVTLTESRRISVQ